MRIDPFRAVRHADRTSPDLARRLWSEGVPDAERKLRARVDPLHTAHLFDTPSPPLHVQQWLQAGTLIQDATPALFVVEVQGTQGGARAPVRFLLGAATVGEDLLELEEGPRSFPEAAALPLVAGDDQRVLRGLLGEACARVPPEWEGFVDGQGVRLWRVDDAALIRRLQSALEEAQVRAVRAVPGRGRVLVSVLPLSDPGLSLHPVHRGLRQLATFSEATFLTLVQGYARVIDLEAPLTTAAGLAEAIERLAILSSGHHAVLFVQPGGRGRILRFRQGLDLAHLKAAPRNPTLRSLDLALLNAVVLQTVLGVQTPEQTASEQLFTVHSVDALVAQVESGLFQAGFALNPPPLWEVRAVMEAQQRLPAGTCTVEPTLPQGLLFLGPQ